MKLKRVLAVLLVACMVLSFAACTPTGTTEPTDDTATTTTVDEAADPTEGETDETEAAPTDEDGNEITTTVPTDEDGNEITTTAPTDEEGNEITEAEDNVTTAPADTDETQSGGDTTTTKKGDTTTTTKVTTTKKGDTTTTAKTTTTTTKKGDKTTKTRTTTTKSTRSTVAKSTQTVAPSGSTSNMGDIQLKEGTKRVTDGLDFGGATYTFAYYGSSWDADHEAWHKDFEKEYNVKLNVRGVDTSKYVEGLASAMAAKTPYDIVFLYSFDYPEQITANLMAPLDDYLTTADLWDKTKKEGFSESLMQAHSLNGKIYSVAGNYLQTPTVIWYNKKMFKDAGYSGKNDPLELYKAGKWDWDTLYEMLSVIQNPSKGLYGINTFGYWGDHQVINSFDTDIAKRTSDGRIVQNLDDPQLYKALETLQKFCCGAQSVANPNDAYESGQTQFLNGTTASYVNTGGAWGSNKQLMDKKVYSAFGTKDTQLSNLGAVPLPTENSAGVHSIWNWMGYGAGNGTTEEGIKCALAFAFHDSQVNHYQAYFPGMSSELKNLFTGILDSDKLRGPMDGFSSAAGSLGGTQGSIVSNVMKGNPISVVLNSYKKQCQKVIDEALKVQ